MVPRHLKLDTPQQWEHVIWSDESLFILFQITGRFIAWWTPAEAFNVDCLIVKHGGGSVIVWYAMSWRGLGPLIVLRVKYTWALSQYSRRSFPIFPSNSVSWRTFCILRWQRSFFHGYLYSNMVGWALWWRGTSHVVFPVPWLHHLWYFVEFFREQCPFSVFFSHTLYLSST